MVKEFELSSDSQKPFLVLTSLSKKKRESPLKPKFAVYIVCTVRKKTKHNNKSFACPLGFHFRKDVLFVQSFIHLSGVNLYLHGLIMRAEWIHNGLKRGHDARSWKNIVSCKYYREHRQFNLQRKMIFSKKNFFLP